MPLVRFEVRNEYGSGIPELYKEADREDPKAVLDGVAVSGLVGILRQLGDLAEFAADVFHGLQEQVMTTASRSHKLMLRVQAIEDALPPLEKAVLAQTSHLHFCYSAGSEWHPRIRNQSNHFVYNDLPQFIMDSYEECRDPPRLHLLDRFDTGGPGSCLKKYSDPTFFKRVSPISNGANAERRKDKKACKSRKKKRSRQKNGEFAHNASVLSGSGRMQFTAPNNYYQPSPDQSQTPSFTDTTFKSDLQDQSFDSRTGSGYIDCVFNISTPLQFVKQDPKESSSSHLNLQKDDKLESSYPDYVRVKCDDFSCGSLQEEAVPNSSYVTWDEKTEIVEPENQNCDGDEALHIFQTDYGQNTKEFFDSTRNVDRENISMDNENIQTIIGGSQLDDIESETDNYMDALNTIESESENDFDCQTKREVEQYTSNSKKSAIKGGIHEIMALESEHHSSNFESHASSVKSLDKDTSIPNLVSLERFSHDDSPQLSGVTSEQDSFPGKVFSESICGGSKSEAITSDLSSPGSKIPYQQLPTNNTGDSQESPAELSGTSAVQFWTNGGLLGLEPSKPPDFRVSNGVNHNLVSESKMDTATSGHNAASDCLSSRQLNETIRESKQPICSTLCYENQEDATNINNPLEKGLTNQVHDRVFGLDHRLLVNGFRKKPSLLHDRTNETAKILQSTPFEHNRAPHTLVNDPGDGSSPPLELMKISFQPINGSFEPSKLKLKYHDGSHIQEVTRDMFPSFQLVPEPVLMPHKIGSESDDDDTFCRSSPTSDDCMSHHSESNSEQWESSETPRSKDQEIYGALSRISSVESISSSHELDGKLDGSILIDNTIKSPYAVNVVESSHLIPVLNIPSFDAVKPLIKMSPDSEESSVFGCQKETTPPPPPLPPMQWRVLKSHSDMAEDKQDFVADGLTHAFDIKQLQSTVMFDEPKPESFNPQQIKAFDMKQMKSAIPLESSVSTPKSKPGDQQKLSLQRATDRAANGKGLDEKEDFLQQIRTQSFNLRPTLTERPAISPVAPTNVKVTAILEKAIAIRQAVGSDDGEDNDTWSDT